MIQFSQERVLEAEDELKDPSIDPALEMCANGNVGLGISGAQNFISRKEFGLRMTVHVHMHVFVCACTCFMDLSLNLTRIKV